MIAFLVAGALAPLSPAPAPPGPPIPVPAVPSLPSGGPAAPPTPPPAPPLAPSSHPSLPSGFPSLLAARATGPVVLDGRLDDATWAAAEETSALTQYYPREGAAPSEPTRVRVLYDADALYVGIDCTQAQAPIVARLTRRDRVAPGDRVTVDISSRADRVTAYHFGVSAAGVLDDGIFFNDSEYSSDWDDNWQAASVVRADGWSVELRIPFRILRFDAAPAQRWGFQIQRYTEERHEWDLWAFRPRTTAAVVSTFGTLTGMTGVVPARALELRWSELLSLRFRDADARQGTRAPPHDWRLAFEFLEKVHPTAATTFDLTINPDFGLVEADQRVLNLSNYEVFYPEKRPFFLEGQDSWSTPRTVFYSRRIGARPADPSLDTTPIGGLAGAPPRETLVDVLGPSRIWSAAKLVGSPTPRTQLGVLSALTGENVARVSVAGDPGAGATVATVDRVADPLTLYNVLRLRRMFGLAGDVGLLATSTNRFERVADPRITNDAYVAAVDGRWRSPSASYVVGGQAVGSVLAGGPTRSQRDGIGIEPGHPGLGATVTAAKPSGEHWLGTLSQGISGRQLDTNDLGYLDRKNDAVTYADVTYRTLAPGGYTTDVGTTLAASHRQTLDGLALENNVRLVGYLTFTNFWSASFTLYAHAAHFDDRETGDGTALERSALVGTELWFESDSRRVLSGAFWGQLQRIGGGYQAQFASTLTLRPHPRLDLELVPTALATDGETRFAAKDAAAPVYYFGKLRAANVSLTARATVGIVPTLTLQLYSQLFLASKHFSEPSQFDAAAAPPRPRLHGGDLQPLAALPAAIAPDTQEAALNVNAVLRWEYRLGSTLFLVYTRAQAPHLTVDPNTTPRLDATVLGGNRGSTDVIMLKASFWWG